MDIANMSQEELAKNQSLVEDCRKLIANGNKVDGVKRFRQQTQCSLKRAFDALGL